MKIAHKSRELRPGAPRPQSAFTLVEVTMASALAAILFVSAMAGFSNAFGTLQLDRENSRAAQILLEKTEMLRLYDWDQITGNDTNTFVPATFSAPFYPDAKDGGFDYAGTVTITNAPISATYKDDLRMVTISL